MAEDVRDTRRRRLDLLRSERRETWRELAKALGMRTGSYLSQLRSGEREFNEKTARKYEKKLGLSNGWFDRDGDALQKSEQHVAIEIVTDVALEVIRIAEKERAKLSPAQLRRITGMAVVQTTKAGKVDSEYIRQLVALAGSG